MAITSQDRAILKATQRAATAASTKDHERLIQITA